MANCSVSGGVDIMPKCTTKDGVHKWGRWFSCYRDTGNTLAEQATQTTYSKRVCKECGLAEREM